MPVPSPSRAQPAAGGAGDASWVTVDLSGGSLTDGASLVAGRAAASIDYADQSGSDTVASYIDYGDLDDGTYLFEIERATGELSETDRSGLLVGIADSAGMTTHVLAGGLRFTASSPQTCTFTNNGSQSFSSGNRANLKKVRFQVVLASGNLVGVDLVGYDTSDEPQISHTLTEVNVALTGTARLVVVLHRGTTDGTTTFTAAQCRYMQIA